MQINQYANQTTSLSNDDFLDVDKSLGGGIYQSNKLLASDLFSQITRQKVYDASTQPQTTVNETKKADRWKNNRVKQDYATMQWLDGDGNVTAYITGEGEFGAVKTKITLDFMNYNTIDIYAQNDLSIYDVANLVNAPTTTLLLNDVAYSLDDPILVGDKITISVDIDSVIVLRINNVIISF
jgi:hypothetical protein